jgi:GNAT superfamily N-acetyltransferase
MPPIDVTDEPISALAEYARVSIAFEVRVVLDVVDGAPDFALSERRLKTPYVKDYDALDGGPARWPERFDLSRWRLFAARMDGQRVGGAAVALQAEDSATLWDLRVSTAARRRGVGAALFAAAARWARAHGCRHLKVETQSINAPACRFYQAQGCVLGAIHHGAYPECPDEVQLLWYMDLGVAAT